MATNGSSSGIVPVIDTAADAQGLSAFGVPAVADFPKNDPLLGKYNSYSPKGLQKIKDKALELLASGKTITDYIYSGSDANLTDEKITLLEAFMQNPNLSIEERVFLRIGKPSLDGSGQQYANSFNFAEQMPEAGVSVVTTGWLDNLKSVFFGAHDDAKIAARGVYAIKGVVISSGGDDEPLIYPTAWAVKTKIKTHNALRKAVKMLEAQG